MIKLKMSSKSKGKTIEELIQENSSGRKYLTDEEGNIILLSWGMSDEVEITCESCGDADWYNLHYANLIYLDGGTEIFVNEEQRRLADAVGEFASDRKIVLMVPGTYEMIMTVD